MYYNHGLCSRLQIKSCSVVFCTRQYTSNHVIYVYYGRIRRYLLTILAILIHTLIPLVNTSHIIHPSSVAEDSEHFSFLISHLKTTLPTLEIQDQQVWNIHHNTVTISASVTLWGKWVYDKWGTLHLTNSTRKNNNINNRRLRLLIEPEEYLSLNSTWVISLRIDYIRLSPFCADQLFTQCIFTQKCARVAFNTYEFI